VGGRFIRARRHLHRQEMEKAHLVQRNLRERLAYRFPQPSERKSTAFRWRPTQVGTMLDLMFRAAIKTDGEVDLGVAL
jgi:hypothetical protein